MTNAELKKEVSKLRNMVDVLKDNADRLWIMLGEGGSSPNTRKGTQAALKALSNRKTRKVRSLNQ
jgi:hypothetical protein